MISSSSVSTHRILPSVFYVGVLLPVLSGCSIMQPWADNEPGYAQALPSIPVIGEVATQIKNDELIAVDLVNALSQIEDYRPGDKVIQLSEPDSDFSLALKDVLQNAGYALRFVTSDATNNHLQHAVSDGAIESNGSHHTYELSIGEIKLKRQYFVQVQGVTPSSNLFVQGADPSTIALNDGLFEYTYASGGRSEPESPDVLKPEQQQVSGLVKTTETTAINSQPVVTTALKRTPTALADSPAKSSSATVDKFGKGPSVLVKQNMYKLGESNFAEMTKDFYDVRQHTLVFGNDSFRIGVDNRAMLRQFINGFEEDTDVLSVIGCSHGRTSLTNGNAVLATGRANRVKEALMYAGIPHEKILEEGCWASEYFDEVMPRRGVVLTLKREPGAS